MPRKSSRGSAKAPDQRSRDAADEGAAWRLFFSPRILTEDLTEIGHAAYETARKAIQKKSPVAPDQYGDGLGPPLTGLWKLKSSHVRIAYHIEMSAREVWVLMIADRDVIWDRHEAEILARLDGERDRAKKRKAAKRSAPDSQRRG
jgi:mRNA-degrading endonuclease RelE of RelBE toxin-antitoxin system